MAVWIHSSMFTRIDEGFQEKSTISFDRSTVVVRWSIDGRVDGLNSKHSEARLSLICLSSLSNLVDVVEERSLFLWEWMLCRIYCSSSNCFRVVSSRYEASLLDWRSIDWTNLGDVSHFHFEIVFAKKSERSNPSRTTILLLPFRWRTFRIVTRRNQREDEDEKWDERTSFLIVSIENWRNSSSLIDLEQVRGTFRAETTPDENANERNDRDGRRPGRAKRRIRTSRRWRILVCCFDEKERKERRNVLSVRSRPSLKRSTETRKKKKKMFCLWMEWKSI